VYVIKFYTPVLLTVSENSDNVWRVFEVIRGIKPPQLYITINSNSKNPNPKNFKTKVDWPCEIKTFFTKTSTDSPLEWFFSVADEGIIIEDTCLPDTSFFWFAQAMLERYRAKSSVLVINGTNIAGTWKSNHSYFFSHYGIAGGWATWKRVWKSDKKELDALFAEGVRDWTKTEFESLTIVPVNNLIEHIDGSPRRIPCASLKFPLEHQIVFKVDSSYDKCFANL